MSDHLIQWIEQQRNTRGWSMNELATRAGLSSGGVADVLNGKSNPGFRFCTAIAKVFNTTPEYVLRLANLLPPEPEQTADLKEALHLLAQLSPEQRRYVLTTIRALATGTPVPASRSS